MRVRVLVFAALLCTAWAVDPRAALAQSADPFEGRVVREIRVVGLNNLSPEAVTRHIATHVGEPFRRETVALDQRRLDELRLFTAVSLQPLLEDDGVVLQVALTETLRLLPAVVIRVTDENGLSAGAGVRTINAFGRGTQAGLWFRFGGETSVGTTVDRTTITPGLWAYHVGASYTERRNPVYNFDEQATTLETRVARNLRRGLGVGTTISLLGIDTGSSGASLSIDGRDEIPSVGGFVTVDTLNSSTNPHSGTWAEFQAERLFGDAQSWTFTLDGRRFQPLAPRHGLALFALASLQTGEPGVELPEYLQFALGGANSVRGWSLGSRIGRNQFLGTLEYSYVAVPVRPFSVAGLNVYAGVQVVTFADLGLASHAAAATTTPTSAIDGYGAGLRVLVPFVDVIRLEVAWGEPGHGATAYFGVSLKAVRQRQRVR